MPSIRESAEQLLAEWDMTTIKAMVEAMNQFVYTKVDVATELLGEFHDGTNAITGTAANIQEVTADLLRKIDLFEWTGRNIAEQLMSGAS